MRTAPGTTDDNLTRVQITDFAGGLVTAIGALSLAQNQFPACLNIIPMIGRVLFRGGWTIYGTIPAAADAAFPFKDSLGNSHYAIWAGGSLYDCFGGGASLVEGAIYTAGQNIGRVSDDGILYWSTGQPNPVPIRFWNPITGGKGQLPGNLSDPSAVDPPASDFLLMDAGSVVALAPTWGSPLTADVYQPTVYAFSNANAPDTWIATNSQQVGSRDGGRLEYARLYGVSDTGISPTKTMLVFRDDFGIWAYTGALGQQEEALLSADVGIVDRISAQFLPTKGQLGAVVWLGNDGQFWMTNGAHCFPISTDQILPTLVVAYREALAASGTPRFPSGYNHQWQYYFCTVGDIQFVWRWNLEAWTLFQGWPIGQSFQAEDANELPILLIASNQTITLDPFVVNQSELGGLDVLADTDEPQQVYIIAEVGKIGFNDNGTMPEVYWKSPVIHGGDYDSFKKFHWADICVLDTGVLYNVKGESTRRSDGTVQESKTIPLQAPNNVGPPFILNQSLLGGADVLADPVIIALMPGTPVSMQGRLAVEIEPTEWWPEGYNSILEGSGMQLTVSYGGGANAFDLLGAGIRYLPQGSRRGAGTFYNPEDITTAEFNPFLGYLNANGSG